MCPDSGLISELRRYWELARSQARENLLRFFDEGSPVLSSDIELIADYSQRFRDIADHLLACHQQNNGEEFQSPCTFSELEHCEQQYLLKSSRLRHTEIILEKLAGAHHAES